MTTKEKAKELVNKYSEQIFIVSGMYSSEEAKQCALICVDEIIKNESRGFDIEDCNPFTQENIIFWQEVKKEIIKL